MMFLVATVLMLADPVTIFTGVNLGDNEASVQAIFPSARIVDVVGKPGLRFLTTRDGTVAFCYGNVSSVQRKIGSDIHAYTDSVQDRIPRYADPMTLTAHYRTSFGETSTVESVWSFSENREYKLGLIVTEDGPVDVTETFLVNDRRC